MLIAWGSNIPFLLSPSPPKHLEIGVEVFQIVRSGTSWVFFNSFLPQAVISEYLVVYL